jgi:hypothetical protein
LDATHGRHRVYRRVDRRAPEKTIYRSSAAARRAQPSHGRIPRDEVTFLTTKDEDFHRLSILRGAPPKVIWVRLGNCSTLDIAKLIREHAEDFRAFHAQEVQTFLELG